MSGISSLKHARLTLGSFHYDWVLDESVEGRESGGLEQVRLSVR